MNKGVDIVVGISKRTKKMIIACGGVVGIFLVAGMVILGGSNNAQDKSSLESRTSTHQESTTKSKKTTQKGSIKTTDLKAQPELSASVIAQYAADSITDNSWSSIKNTVEKKQALVLWVVVEPNGAVYHFGEVKNSPHYRLVEDGNVVIYYDSNDSEVKKIKLNEVVKSVNMMHTNKDMNDLKKNVSVKIAEDEKSSSFQQFANNFSWAGHSTGARSAMFDLNEDGTFSGSRQSKTGMTVAISEFQGTLGDLVKINDNVFEAKVLTLSSRPEGTTSGTPGTAVNKVEYMKVDFIKEGDTIRLYRPGYSGSETKLWSQMHLSSDVLRNGETQTEMLVIDNEFGKTMPFAVK